MSSKGQIVVPKEIRKDLRLEKGANFAIYGKGDTLILKKMKTLSPDEMFEQLTKWGTKFAKEKGIKSEEDVVRIIHEGRRRRA